MIGTAINFKSTDGGTSYIVNDRANQPLLEAEDPFYYISVKNVEGLGTADISYESHPIPNATGEKSGDVFRRGTTLTLSGSIQGLDLNYLEEGADFLGQMFSETDLRRLIWIRRDGEEVYMLCRVSQDLSIVRNFDSGVYRWPWVVGLRANKPFTYKTSDDSLYPTWQQ